MNPEEIAAVRQAAKRRRAAIRARDEASAVLADAARRMVESGSMGQREFASLAGVSVSTVRGWLGLDPMNRPRRSPMGGRTPETAQKDEGRTETPE